MIELENQGETTIVRMVRGKGNALNLDLLTAMLDALDQLEGSPARAGILTGEGNVFGAGVDLAEMVAGGAAYVRQFLPRLDEALERLATFPKPLVAAINGHAIAGGAIVMLACDQRLLARGRARIGLTEIQVGVPFPSWALEIARYTTPREHFSTLILTGHTWQPDDALARGLVDELVEPEQLLPRALEVAAELGSLVPETYAATKLAVRRPMLEAARRSAAEDTGIVEYWSAPETLAQIAGFVERTIKRKG